MSDVQSSLARLKRLEQAMDRQFSFAGIRFGVDAIIGLVPVVGDLISGAIGLYIIAEARRLGVSRWAKGRMYANWGLDVSFGALPIVGDVFDVVFKSNTKNVRLLIADLEKRDAKAMKMSTKAAHGGKLAR
jgi:hypothetical protein